MTSETDLEQAFVCNSEGDLELTFGFTTEENFVKAFGLTPAVDSEEDADFRGAGLGELDFLTDPGESETRDEFIVSGKSRSV